MPKDKTKSEKFAGKLLEIAVNSIDLYYEDEAKQASKRRWTIARSKISAFSSFKTVRKVKTINDISK